MITQIFSSACQLAVPEQQMCHLKTPEEISSFEVEEGALLIGKI
jgi:hypothetical protein